MFRIRRIHDDTLSIDKEAIAQVQKILRNQFSTLSDRDVTKLTRQLKDPVKYRFRSILFIAENLQHHVLGFALVQHAPDIGFCFLDYISVEPHKSGGGVGGALYEQVREEAAALSGVGLFFESLPDEPDLCGNPALLEQNRARLKFYERFGATPITHTAYETPLKPEDTCPPHLVFDPLGKKAPLSRELARAIIRSILERKYGSACPPGYIDRIVASVQDDPVRVRKPRYSRTAPPEISRPRQSIVKRIALVVNDRHDIHHVHERGYVEAPVRISRILEGLEKTGLFDRLRPHHFSERDIKAVHANGYVEYFKRMCTRLEPGRSIYPYVFPIRNSTRPPKELPVRAGYYCIDTFTPLNRNAFTAAKRAVDCTLTAARSILQGYRLAYALVRPPGHHAEREAFGGFCYFNNAAVAANYLSRQGRVAVLDIDFHHGNGTQDIFYDRADVLTLSIHGHPSFAYPYFSGFADERGFGAGEGFNRNYPMPEHLTGEAYRKVLAQALRRIQTHRPHFLIVALGLDTAKGDPTGTWNLTAKDLEINGRLIGSLRLPTLVVQEGGYRTRSLGLNARHFFEGLFTGAFAPLDTAGKEDSRQWKQRTLENF